MSLKLSEVIELAHKQDWSKISNFSVELSPFNKSFAKLISWGDPKSSQKQISLCLKSIDVPQYTTNLIEEYNGIRWYQSNSRDELYTATLTFKDMNGAELYRKFINAFNQTKGNYFDKCVFNLDVYINSNIQGSDSKVLIMSTNMAYITSVSQLQLNHENGSEILEFSIEFKFNTPTHSNNFLGLIDETSNDTKTSIVDEARNLFTEKLFNSVDNLENKILDKINSW